MKPFFAIPVTSTLALTCLLIANTASADSRKEITQAFDASDFDKLRLEITAGEIDIDTYDGEEIQVEISLRSQRRWFSWNNGDVDDVELTVREGESELFLRIDEKDIEQHWQVNLPAKLALEMELGVGEVHIKDFSNNLEMEVGVGEIRVDVISSNYRSIHASTGVGDANIRGFEGGSGNERNFISADAYYEGRGDMEIEIELGVGEIQIRNDE